MKMYSSFRKQQLITESWRRFLNEEQENQELILKKPEQLDDEQKKKLEVLLNKADAHEEFSGFNLVIGPEYDSRRIAFLLGDQVVGFMTPRKESRFDDRWRTGAIFVDEEFRGRSIAPSAIKQFFKDKKGYAWISNNNVSSQKAFRAAGFKKGDERSMGDSPSDQGYDWFKD